MKKKISIIPLTVLIILSCVSFPNKAEEQLMGELYIDVEQQETQTLTPTAQASAGTEASIVPSSTPASMQTAQPGGMEDENSLPIDEGDTPDDENSEQECIYITIPSRIDITEESARKQSFNISVRGFDTLSGAAVVNISVSSKNHFYLQGEESALAYGLCYGDMDHVIENASAVASFSNDGAREMILVIHDELPQCGQYMDTLTFTFNLVRGDA